MDVTLTLKCNNDCVFCPRRDYLKMIACGRQLYREIRAIRRVSDSIVLSGGEVTVLRRIWEIIGFCRESNFRTIDLITNGRKLKDSRFAERLAKAGINNFAVSLYSVDESIHDMITRVKGSCRETKKGIMNLLRLSPRHGIDVRVNIVLNPWNYKTVEDTLRYLFDLGVKNFIIAEQVVIDKKARRLSLAEITGFLARVRHISLRSARLSLRGFAPCMCGEGVFYPDKQRVLKKRDPLIVWEPHEMDTLVKDKDKKSGYLKKLRGLFAHTERCGACFLNSRCPGIQKVYF